MDDLDATQRAEAMSYKLRKEAFVSNLSGSSLTDISLVTIVAASATLLWTSLSKRGLFTDSSPVIIYTIDFLLNVCAILFAFTIYSSAPIFLNILFVTPAVLLLLPLQQRSGRLSKNSKKNKHEAPPPSSDGKSNQATKSSEQHPEPLQSGTLISRPLLTSYRGAMLIATSLAILAVDFHVFPRRFAKVETWGTSLMDLGVGSFVFSAGIVGARTVIRETQQASTVKANVLRRMTKALRHSLPLLALGIARLISVKNLDYAEHVTEYGVHWNFFFTLALLPPFVEAIDSILTLLTPSETSLTSSSKKTRTSSPGARSFRYDIVALLISIIYEIILNSTPLQRFILIAPRTPYSTLLIKNREGIFSFFGYLAIFLAGRSTGILLCQFQLPSYPSVKTKKSVSPAETEAGLIARERRIVVLPTLLGRAMVYAGLYVCVTHVNLGNVTVSRRLANLPYVLWIVAYNDAQLLLFGTIEAVGLMFTYRTSSSSTSKMSSDGMEILSASEVASPIMTAFNKNGLALFLVSNLGTGVVNLTVNTLDMGSGRAMGVLIVYAGVLSAVAIGLDRVGWKIKL